MGWLTRRKQPWSYKDPRTNWFYQDNEHGDQAKVFRWLRGRPELGLRMSFPVPNGALHSKDMRLYFAEEGVYAGVTDFVIPHPMHPYHGAVAELKHGDNEPTREQLEFMAAMNSLGYVSILAWGAELMIEGIKEYAEIL